MAPASEKSLRFNVGLHLFVFYKCAVAKILSRILPESAGYLGPEWHTAEAPSDLCGRLIDLLKGLTWSDLGNQTRPLFLKELNGPRV